MKLSRTFLCGIWIVGFCLWLGGDILYGQDWGPEFPSQQNAAPSPTPQFLDTSGWNFHPSRQDFGPRHAMSPKYLWLDWNDVPGARSYVLYREYSRVPFPAHRGKYAFFSKVNGSAYHSGDNNYQSGVTQKYVKPGYYRFKVTAILSDNKRTALSEPLTLVLWPQRPLHRTTPQWAGGCWNANPHRVSRGTQIAKSPQYLWLDWMDMDNAAFYEIHQAYSPIPFQKGSAQYKFSLSTRSSHYHSGDVRFMTGGTKQYRQAGYYRFKIRAVSSKGEKSLFSSPKQLTLQ